MVLAKCRGKKPTIRAWLSQPLIIGRTTLGVHTASYESLAVRIPSDIGLDEVNKADCIIHDIVEREILHIRGGP
jgi:hypothetical protein